MSLRVFAARSSAVVSAFLVLAVWAGPAEAQVARVFVSVNGNDANVCSNIATPCRTLGGGITQVDSNGEVIVIDTGSYAGATITKPVKINVPSGIVAFSGQPVVSDPGVANTVVIRGLTLKAATPGTGTGLYHASGRLIVENTVIDGWSTGILIGAAEPVAINHTTIRNCSIVGLFMGAATTVTVDNSNFISNFGNGSIVVGTGSVSVDRSAIVNSSWGLWAVGGGSAVLRRSLVSGCSYGVVARDAFTNVRLSQNAITNNSTGVKVDVGGTVTSFGNNEIAGNSFDVTGSMTTAVLQ
jgi:hypothetical protein